jgi:glucose/mannose-6-phosphate isomerase
MVDLDDLAVYRKLDPQDMLGQIYSLPQQCLTAWNKSINFVLPDDYRNIDKIVVLGMGGSAIGGDLLRSLISNKEKLSITVCRDYELPLFVDEKTLVIASSYSGNTEETLTSFNQSLKTGSKKLAITTGGKLMQMAERAGVPVFKIEHVSPPRAALGFSLMPLIAICRNLGFLNNVKFEINTVIETLKKLLEEWQESRPMDSNLAKQIANKVYGKMVVIYGAGLTSEVARRWKTQINENSKTWAFFEILPELDHNSVVGYRFPIELAKQAEVIFLRSYSLNQRILVRYQVTIELLQQSGVNYQIVDSAGDDDLSRMMSLVYLGDWVSYYLAILNQVDPTPVKTIDYLKERLSGTQGLLF